MCEVISTRCVDVMNEDADPVVRADIANEIVESVSRYENVKHDVLYPWLRKTGRQAAQLDRAERDQHDVRRALVNIRNRMHNVKPVNAHASDPEGLENSVEVLVDSVRSHLRHEDQELLPMVERLDASEAKELGDKIEIAAAHASGHPDPPHNRLGRKLMSLGETAERVLHDQSTPWHPGLDRVKQAESRKRRPPG